MIKNILFAMVVLFLAGCSSKSLETSKYSVTEPTDYAMNCNSLLNEINEIKAKLNNNENFLESFVPDSLINKETLTDSDRLVLSERKKSLQLIYTLKEAKHECRTLTVEDTKETKKITKMVKEVKDTATEVSNEIQN